MGYRFSCAPGGVVCNATISGKTEDEVLEKAVAHVKDKHGVDLASSATLARYARSLIVEEGR